MSLADAFYITEIVDIKVETPKIKRFFLKFDFEIDFKPGQFSVLKFPGLNHTFDTRSYSISSFDKANHIIELCVVIKEDGAATPVLFDYKVGEKVMASVPVGRFVLPENLPNHDITFICTGTGIAPFRAMIQYLLENQFKHKISLYFGNRFIKDIIYHCDFLMWQMNFENFIYKPVLSREEWNGLKGYIHPYYTKDFQDKPECLFYLCGWSESMKEARNNLKELGYTRENIKVEFYD